VILLFDNFIHSISIDLNLIASNELKLTFPFIPPSFLIPFLEEMKNIFQQEPSLLEFDGEVIVIGDLHGHYLDLCRILKTFQLPIKHKYLFLGDLVDRGESSFETIFIIFLLKYLYRDTVYIIRGNHEFQSVCSSCGFLSNIRQIYNCTSIFVNFLDTFSYLPFAAIVQSKYFCLHGGLSKNFHSTDQIKSIEKPINQYDNPAFISGIVWSDPNENAWNFLPSPRKAGEIFGSTQVDNFLSQNNLQLIIRGHECVDSGIKIMFENKLVTVFSASNYCEKNLNKSGILIVHENGQIGQTVFPHFQYYKREFAVFENNSSKDYLMSSIKCQLLPQTTIPEESRLSKKYGEKFRKNTPPSLVLFVNSQNN
jgi:protein phosphatase